MSGDSNPYADYIASALRDQDERKESIERRGLAVVTTAGVLVTLLFGLVATITKQDKFQLPRQAHGPLGVALCLFGGAALLGVATNVPLRYKNIDPRFFDKLFDKYWNDPKDDPELRIAVTRARMFARAQAVNGFKAGC